MIWDHFILALNAKLAYGEPKLVVLSHDNKKSVLNEPWWRRLNLGCCSLQIELERLELSSNLFHPLSLTAKGLLIFTSEREGSVLNFALVGSVYDLKPNLEKLTSYALNRWKKYGFLNIYCINFSLFLFQFFDEYGYHLFLRNGPFSFDNHPFILRKWSPRMSLDVSSLCSAPVWI